MSGRVVVPGKPMASQVQIPFEGVILQEHSAPISCPTPNFAKGSPFNKFFRALDRNLFPSRPLADPSRASSNPFVALRRSSWPFVDIFLPFPGNLSPLPDLWRIPVEPSPTPQWPFVLLRAPSWITLFLFPSVPLVDPLGGFLFLSFAEPAFNAIPERTPASSPPDPERKRFPTHHSGRIETLAR